MAKKEKAPKGAKKGKKGAPAPQGDWPHISVSAHPSAARAIRRTKAWAGLLTFVLVAVLSERAGVAPFEVGVRALIAGIGVYVVAWMASVALWQRVVLHEAKSEAERRRDERLALEQRMREAREGGGDDEAAAA